MSHSQGQPCRSVNNFSLDLVNAALATPSNAGAVMILAYDLAMLVVAVQVDLLEW